MQLEPRGMNIVPPFTSDALEQSPEIVSPDFASAISRNTTEYRKANEV